MLRIDFTRNNTQVFTFYKAVACWSIIEKHKVIRKQEIQVSV